MNLDQSVLMVIICEWSYSLFTFVDYNNRNTYEYYHIKSYFIKNKYIRPSSLDESDDKLDNYNNNKMKGVEENLKKEADE